MVEEEEEEEEGDDVESEGPSETVKSFGASSSNAMGGSYGIDPSLSALSGQAFSSFAQPQL